MNDSVANQPDTHLLKHARIWLAAVLGVCAISLSGCAAAGVFAILQKGIEESTPKKVFAEYEGLAGKSFAVLVSIDRSVQAEYPALSAELSARITERIVEGAGASGFVPPADVLGFIARTPSWPVMRREELAERLGGVQRLIVIEITEYRLREAGNRYLWDGQASGLVSVMESDGPLPDQPIFQRQIRVRFPDGSGFSEDDMSGQLVQSALAQRFSNRAAWLFFDHEEPPGITY